MQSTTLPLQWRAALAAVPAILLAYLVRRRLLQDRHDSWSHVVLPSQALWSAIPSYYRHHTLPILSFRSDQAGLGDPATMATIASRFEPRPSDVHIVTYPKAGTSWIQEVAWLINHDADFERSSSVPSSQRTVYVELDLPGMDKLARLADATGPRHIKWHHSADLLPRRVVEEGRVIYLMRNPKDLVVSWYHFQRMNKLYAFTGTFDDFFEHFLRGDVAYGSYWHNVLSWWARRAQPNVLFLTYEEMHLDLPDVVRRVANFVGKPISEERAAAVADWCAFEQMKQNPATNAANMPKVPGTGEFMRKGQVGDWRNHFSDEQSRRMDRWIEAHTGGTGWDVPLVFDIS